MIGSSKIYFKDDMPSDDIESVSNLISDFLCWWEGYKAGCSTHDDNRYEFAQHSVNQIREINIALKEQLEKKRKGKL